MAWRKLKDSSNFITLAIIVLLVNIDYECEAQQTSASTLSVEIDGNNSTDSHSGEDNNFIVVGHMSDYNPRLDLTPALPDGLCNRKRNNFVRYGCTTKESAYCSALNRGLTREILGKPACLDYPCEGYGNPVGFFLCNSTCVDGTADMFGICGENEICCLT